MAAIAFSALLLPVPAGAQASILEQAADELRIDGVYRHSESDSITAADEQRLERRIVQERAPVFIAVLPGSARAEAGGSSTGVALRLGRLVRIRGTYAVVVGKEFRAVSSELGQGEAGRLASQSFQANRGDGVAAVLNDFVGRVGEARQAEEVTAEDDSSGGFPSWLLVVGAGIAGLFGLRAYRRRQRERRELADVKVAAREDLVALADDVVGLDADVEMPSADPRAKDAYVRGMEAYQRADDSFDKARSPRDISKVTYNLTEARHKMETAKAFLAGKPAPEPRAPCFFDARHGSSVRDVTWTSPYGGPVEVPACEADAQKVEAGEEPDMRQVPVGDGRRPVWDAPGYYGGWAGGFYGGGILPAFFVGSMLAGGFGHAGAAEAAPGGGFDNFDGGDFGGGSGGGDF